MRVPIGLGSVNLTRDRVTAIHVYIQRGTYCDWTPR